MLDVGQELGLHPLKDYRCQYWQEEVTYLRQCVSVHVCTYVCIHDHRVQMSGRQLAGYPKVIL